MENNSKAEKDGVKDGTQEGITSEGGWQAVIPTRPKIAPTIPPPKGVRFIDATSRFPNFRIIAPPMSSRLSINEALGSRLGDYVRQPELNILLNNDQQLGEEDSEESMSLYIVSWKHDIFHLPVPRAATNEALIGIWDYDANLAIRHYHQYHDLPHMNVRPLPEEIETLTEKRIRRIAVRYRELGGVVVALALSNPWQTLRQYRDLYYMYNPFQHVEEVVVGDPVLEGFNIMCRFRDDEIATYKNWVLQEGDVEEAMLRGYLK